MLKYIILLEVLLIILVEVLCYFSVHSTVEEQANSTLLNICREAPERLKSAKDESAASEYLLSFRNEGVSVTVLSQSGEVLLPENDSWRGDFESIKNILNDVGGGKVVTYSHDGNLNCAVAVDYKQGGVLVASCSLKIIHRSTRPLIIYFVLVGVFIVLIAVLVTYTISQKLSAGVKNLSTTAVRFSKGDLNVNFANAEYQELADLSDTLNSVRDEVKKSGDFQREIVANVSHDLKTPLTMIKAYASMIREISGDNPEKRDKHLQVIIDEADRLTGLVNDVLNVSKVNSNLDTINTKVFNLTEFLYGIINKFGYLQETQGYNFMIDIESNLYTRADEEKIGQVIYNLLGNAVNYTGEDKTVYISLKKNMTGERIRFTVKDTGKGIAKEELPEIWNRYYRAKENHNRPVKGTGLGLNIVKIILENHKFDFGVQSEKGQGSSFWVDFPAISSEIENPQ